MPGRDLPVGVCRRGPWKGTTAVSGSALVTVMQAANLGDGDHAALGRLLDVPGERSVSFEGEIGPRFVVLAHVFLKDAPQVGLAPVPGWRAGWHPGFLPAL
jgi:hypothetical protein